MRYAVVRLTRSETSARVSAFRPWEVTILEQIHGKGSVEVVGEEDHAGPYPDPEAEYERLGTRYGSPEGSDVPYVQTVFGIGNAGLARAIEEAEEEALSREPMVYAPVIKRDLKAEAAELAADRAEIAAERKAARDEQAALDLARAEIEASKAELAEREKQLEVDRAELDALLDEPAATAATAEKVAAKPAKPAKAAATPISE